jgi:hypothetical protein
VPQRRHVGLDDEVAVALGPARRRVARNGLHVDVVGEQIVAAVRFLVSAIDEELGLEPLADQAPLHVDEACQDGIDRAGANRAFQRVERKVSGHVKLSLRKRGKLPKKAFSL